MKTRTLEISLHVAAMVLVIVGLIVMAVIYMLVPNLTNLVYLCLTVFVVPIYFIAEIMFFWQFRQK